MTISNAESRASNFLRTLYKCKLQLGKAALMIDGATCHATREEGSIVTHRGSVVPGKRNMKAFILVQFDR